MNLGEQQENNSVYNNAAFFTFLNYAVPNGIKIYELIKNVEEPVTTYTQVCKASYMPGDVRENNKKLP